MWPIAGNGLPVAFRQGRACGQDSWRTRGHSRGFPAASVLQLGSGLPGTAEGPGRVKAAAPTLQGPDSAGPELSGFKAETPVRPHLTQTLSPVLKPLSLRRPLSENASPPGTPGHRTGERWGGTRERARRGWHETQL